MGSLQEFNGFPPGNLQCNTAVSAILMGAPCALMGSKGTLMGSWREHWGYMCRPKSEANLLLNCRRQKRCVHYTPWFNLHPLIQLEARFFPVWLRFGFARLLVHGLGKLTHSFKGLGGMSGDLDHADARQGTSIK